MAKTVQGTAGTAVRLRRVNEQMGTEREGTKQCQASQDTMRLLTLRWENSGGFGTEEKHHLTFI